MYNEIYSSSSIKLLRHVKFPISKTIMKKNHIFLEWRSVEYRRLCMQKHKYRSVCNYTWFSSDRQMSKTLQIAHTVFSFAVTIITWHTKEKTICSIEINEKHFFSNFMKNIYFYEQQVSGVEKNRTLPYMKWVLNS